ncbi:MAG: threonylcarbamoyl-AMP synthase [Prevotellaceae bacterium]|nr:threonylcarbamoyl-AMP synthase [Candidatus Faecinaster equi]
MNIDKPKYSFQREDLNEALQVLRDGGVILYPTDTIWGLGCDATNKEAVKKIYDIKRRDDSKALIILVDSELRMQMYAQKVPNVAWDILDLATKPTTLILDGARNLATNLIAEDGSVGIRITKEEFSQQLCFHFGKAIVSTSANISGEPSPKNFSEISEEIINAVDYVVKYKHSKKYTSQPSSIIKLGERGEVKVIRQ